MLRKIITYLITFIMCSAAVMAQDRDNASDRNEKFAIRTSIPSWAAAVINIAGEYNFHDRWSMGLDLLYSGWDYGRSDRKFRTYQVRPEVRYWLREDRLGIFADAHLAVIGYNVALPSWKYRIQDHDGKRPALGGGLGIGYRFKLGHSKHWRIEANVGFGVYALYYDRYYNNRQGQLFDSHKRVFFGIDNVSLSLVYAP